MNHYTKEHIDFMAIKLAKRPNSCVNTDLDHASMMLFQLARDCKKLEQQLTELADKVREECAQVCKDLADGAREARNLNIRRHGYSGDPAIMMQAYAYAEAAIRAMKETKP